MGINASKIAFGNHVELRQKIPERSAGKGIGNFFGAIQIDGFIDKD